jgi:ABC-type lipoprotein export system ATPase subunit
MNINIKNVKNIKEIEFCIEDNKMNIIIGPSGSGKSSICEALLSEDIARLKSLYSVEEPTSFINSVKTSETNHSIIAFNDSYKDKIILKRTENKSDVFDIFVGDDSEYENYLNDFNNAVQVLDNNRDEIKSFIEKVKNIETEILRLTTQGKIHNSSKIIVFENKLQTLNINQIKVIKRTSSDYFNWFKQGVEKHYNENNRCPFCKRKLSDRILNTIDVVKSMDDKEIKLLGKSKPLLEDINVILPNFFNKRDLSTLKKRIIEKITVKNQLVKLIEYLQIYSNVNSANDRHIKKIDISKKVYDEFEDLEQIIERLNETIPSLNSAYNKCVNNLTKRIKKSEKELNQYLALFGIPYKFVLNEYASNSKEANYVLSHIKDDNGDDRTYGLSYGEKNIISLLIFILNIKSDFVIIDDPASSFDEYKRKTIYDLILSKTKGITTLILSHDFVFGKFIAYDKHKNKKDNRLGKLLFIENFDFTNAIIVKGIIFSDFQSLENHILNYFKENIMLSYSEKIVLLRMLFERDRHKVRYKSKYSYLSAILHRDSQSSILESLDEANLSEEQIINDITMYLKDNGVNNFTLPLYDQGCSQNSNNLFIKLMMLRETITNNRMKKELSSIIHLNEAHVIQLNPLRFNIFSKNIYDCVNS